MCISGGHRPIHTLAAFFFAPTSKLITRTENSRPALLETLQLASRTADQKLRSCVPRLWLIRAVNHSIDGSITMVSSAKRRRERAGMKAVVTVEPLEGRKLLSRFFFDRHLGIIVNNYSDVRIDQPQ
jgi:hypothetical protein